MSPMSVKFLRKASGVSTFEFLSSLRNLVCLVVRNWTSLSRDELARSPKILNLEFSDKYSTSSESGFQKLIIPVRKVSSDKSDSTGCFRAKTSTTRSRRTGVVRTMLELFPAELISSTRRWISAFISAANSSFRFSLKSCNAWK